MKLGKVRIENNIETNSCGRLSEKFSGTANDFHFAIQNLDSDKITNNSQVISVSVIKDNVSDSNDSLNDRVDNKQKQSDQKQFKRTEIIDEPEKEETQ